MADLPREGAMSSQSNHSQSLPLEQRQFRSSASIDPFAQPGLEVASANQNDKHSVNNVDHGDKIAFNQAEKEAVHFHTGALDPTISSEPPKDISQQSPRNHRICGIRKAVFWALVIIALVVVALAVGLGVGLSSRQFDEASSSPTSDPTTSSEIAPSATPGLTEMDQIGGSIDPAYYSTSGAWNGSGIVHLWQNFSQNWEDIPTANEHSHVVYYQHYSGDIRWMRDTSNAESLWKEGPEDLLVVASDAKNSTPITGVQYTINGTNTWHVFYLDTNNVIRQRSSSNRSDSEGWTDGSISRANLTAWDGDLVGLTACWSSINASIPIRLWYASDNETFEEYLWFAERDEWVRQPSWDGYNGAAGVGFHTGAGFNTYVGMVNTHNELKFFYQRTAGEDLSNWQEASYTIFNVDPRSSVSFTQQYATYQSISSNRIRVEGIIWDGEHTRARSDDISPSQELSGVSGTHLSALNLGEDVWLFYQRSGDEITWLWRRGTDTRWTVNAPIPVRW